MRPVWRSTLAAAAVAALAATTAPSLALDQGDSGDSRPIVGGPDSPHGAADPSLVTLITGDRVQVTDGDVPTVSVLPREDGSRPLVETRRVGDDVYVYPAEAAQALATGKVDEELFNVTGLVRQGYDDAHTDTLPLIAEYADAKAPTVAPRGSETGTVLESIDSVALEADKSKAATFWADLTNPRSRAADSIEKLWLDQQVIATLDRSVAQVHAPEAWAADFDGAGATVAILDTGADADHPDLQGRIIVGKDFTESPNGWNDMHGHGTHVASTVGGSGQASEGLKKGVAPHADLLVGKVLGDSGGGATSGIVAGMEWAVAQGADVISMSLGSTEQTTTCDDPMALAVESLSASSDSLFVIAAGNNGPANNTVNSPGCTPAALTVGAVDRDDSTAVFSSRGPVNGTHVLKPEITAPGVGISAAAAGGRGVYAYRSMSGTSMATPHVAGAAAIVKQRHPGWTGEQIKAVLVSSADSDIPGDVRETGGGRLDVAAAIDQFVESAPSVQGGSFSWPQVKADAKTVQVPYTNDSIRPVKLKLRVAGVTGNDGSVVNADLAKLGTNAVTVGAGQTVNVPLRLNPVVNLTSQQYGDVTGRVIATGDETVSTPFSLYVEPETVRLRIKLIDRNGDAASGASSLDLVNTDTAVGSRWANNGAAEQIADVRPGHYFVSSYVVSPDAEGTTKLSDSVSYLARPELDLTKDTTLVLDARGAHRITVQTDRPSQNRTTTLSFARTWDGIWGHSGSLMAGPTVRSYFADIQGTPKDGDFEFGNYWRRYAPLVDSMKVVDGPALHPAPASYSSTNLDGTGELPVVDAGLGSADEVAAADVAGKIALVQVPDNTTSVASAIFAARTAGAKAVLVHHAASGRWQPQAGVLGSTIPVYALPSTEATALKARLASGPSTLRWTATASSPYVYNLGFTQGTPFTKDKEFVVHDSALGRTESTFRAMGAATDYLDAISVITPSGEGLSVSSFEPVKAPSQRTELYSSGDTSWQQGVLGSFPFGEVMIGQARTYQPGSSRTETWYDGTLAPTAAQDSSGVVQLSAERQGNLIGFASGFWGDSSGHWSPGGSFGDIGNLTLRRNGELVDELPYTFGVFEVPAEDSEYELSLYTEKIGAPARFWKRSTVVVTAWKFRSHLEEDVYSQVVPVMFPRLDLPEDGLKTLPATDDQVIPLRVTGHAGYTPGAITAATLSYSYDGSTWTDADVHEQNGTWVALVDHAGASGQPVTLRVQLTDSNGNSVTQTVTRAYDVR
jgi:subtilisin family serine protease